MPEPASHRQDPESMEFDDEELDVDSRWSRRPHAVDPDDTSRRKFLGENARSLFKL